jgi:hypothetical protein
MTDTTTVTTKKPHTGPRFAHFHAGATHKDKNGVVHSGKGRLLATIATTELPDGTIAVGVSRCNPADNPVRFIGRQKAQARLDRLLASVRNEALKPTQAEMLATERAELLAFRMTREAFLQKVIGDGTLRRLAQAEDPQEVRRLTDELRKSVL